MKNAKLLYFFCLFQANIGFSQDYLVEVNKLMNEQSSLCLILGEDHFERNLPHQSLFIQKFFDLNEEFLIGLEIPDLYEKLVNDYVDGKSDSIFCVMNPINNKHLNESILSLITLIKEYNEYKPNKLRIKCIDSPSDNISQSLWAIKYNFKDIENIETLTLFNYFDLSFKDGKSHKANKIYNCLIKDFEDNNDLYKEILAEYFEEYVRNLKSLEIMFGFYDIYDFRREDYLYKNAEKLMQGDKKSLIFTGNMHADLDEENNGYTNLKLKSYSSRLKKKYDTRVYSILTQYCKKCNFFELFPAPILTNSGCDSIFDKKKNYIIFKSNRMSSENFGYGRSDYVLVVNGGNVPNGTFDKK